MPVERHFQACVLLEKEQDMTEDTSFHVLYKSINLVTKLVKHMRIDNNVELNNLLTCNL